MQSSQIGLRKHVSPLVNFGTSEDSASASETSHPTSTSTSKLPPSISKSTIKDSNEPENVFPSSLFQTSAKHEDVFRSSQFETCAKKTVFDKQGNIFVTSQLQQQPSNIFGALMAAKTLEKQGSVSKIHLPTFDTNISNSSNVTKIFQSPLTNVASIQDTTNNPRKIFGAGTNEKSHFGKQESIFTSSETNSGNVLSVVSEPVNNFSNAPQTSSATSSLFSAQSVTQTKAHPSPLAGLVSGRKNSGNIFGKTTTLGVMGEKLLSSQSDINFNKEAVNTIPPGHSSIAVGAPSLLQHSVFGSAALPPSSTGYSNSSLFQTPTLPQAKWSGNITSAGSIKLPISTAYVLDQSGKTPPNFSGSFGGRKRVSGSQETEFEKMLSSDGGIF